MRGRWATTACSAIALSLTVPMVVPGVAAEPSPLRLFPAPRVWGVPLDVVVTVTPAFEGHLAFLPVEGDALVAWDLDRAERLWSVAARPLSMPATGDGLVFMAEADSLVAFYQDSGALAWRHPFGEPLALPLVWDIGWLIGATVGGTVHAFRGTDGERIWQRDLGARVHAPPALAADRVYVPLEDGRVVALHVATGEPLWERRLGDAPNEVLALEDRLYVGSTDNFFYCLLAATGEIAWRWRTGADVIGVPVVDENRVYFVSKDNVLRGLDRRSGSQRWKRGLPTRPTRGPVRVGDLLLVSGVSTKVSAFAMQDGAPTGDLTATGELAAAPYARVVARLPEVFLFGRDLEHGTRAVAFRRLVGPLVNERLVTLPNPIPALPPPPPALWDLLGPATQLPLPIAPGPPPASTPDPKRPGGPAPPMVPAVPRQGL